jgi:LPXTG-motif cell wall-anchored protein
MSVHAAPVQTGGVAVLGVSFLKTGGSAIVRGRTSLAATGAESVQFLIMLATALITLGLLLVKRGRGATLGSGTFD